MTNKTPPRGIRNNNPGNLRSSKDPWQGLAKDQPDKDFFVFSTPIYGIRALARTLIAYQDEHNLRTVGQIINRWAPASENNTAVYIAAVAKDTGFKADQSLNMHDYRDLKPFVTAIINFENGQQPYTSAQVDKALVLAGVESPPKNLQYTRTVKGGKVATAATVGLGALQAVQDGLAPVRDALQTLVPYLHVARWLLLTITLIGIGVMIWARIDDHRKGLR